MYITFDVVRHNMYRCYGSFKFNHKYNFNKSLILSSILRSYWLPDFQKIEVTKD